MMMLTKANQKTLPALGSTQDEEDPIAVVKYFQPWGSWTWYCVEGGKQEDGDWLFFGMVDGTFAEFGGFTLSDLTSIRGPFGLKIERDLHWTPKRISEIKTYGQ